MLRAVRANYLTPMRRLMRFWSAGLTTVALLSRRLRLVLFFSRMWLWPDLRRLSLPFFLTSKRPAAPWWVFIFGIDFLRVSFWLLATGLAAREKSRFAPDEALLYQTVALAAGSPLPAASCLGSGLGGLLGVLCLLILFPRDHDHHHVAAVEVRLALDAAKVFQVAGEPPKQPLAQLRVLHLAPPEHYGDLHLVAA